MSEDCEHDFYFSKYCGADVCKKCNLHAHLDSKGNVMQTLARCFCGWRKGSEKPEGEESDYFGDEPTEDGFYRD